MARKTYTLSHPKSRTELITEFRAKNLALASAPTVAPTPSKTPPPAPKSAPSTDDTDAPTGDSGTDAAIAELEKGLAAAKAAQATDPDDSTDPNDKKVDATIAQIESLVAELKAEQGTDEANDAPTDDSDAPPTKKGVSDAGDVNVPKKNSMAIKNETPQIDPVDEDGNVDPDAVCATDGCNHLASVHSDTQDGDNAGACTAPDCVCPGFMSAVGTPGDPEGDDADGSGDGGGPNNSGGDDNAPATDTNLAAPAPIEAIVPPAAPPAPAPASSPMAPPTANPKPDTPPSMTPGVAFTIPVMVIEGQDTGDGRSIAIDALTWGALPIPLMGMATATHDPSGMDINDPSIMCGHIDEITKTEGENGTQLISATGHFLDNDDGNYFADLVTQMGSVGISADIAVDESEETITEMDSMGFPVFSSTLTAGVIQGATIVPFPAFSGAYITTAVPGSVEAIPQQSEDDMPMPDIVASGGFLIHYMTHEECLPCEQGYDLVASGVPVRPPRAWFDDPHFTEGDGRLKEIFTGRGDERFGGSYACPFTITDEGEVYGHLAPWGVCHTGEPGACVTPPRSKAGYAHFLRVRQPLLTAEGDEVNVGVLTFDTGHAAQGRSVGAMQAAAHYDNTGTAFADVNVGEDDFGIWIHGALRPDIDELTLRRIRASAPSGDWRKMNGNLELCAILNVNTPGFPVTTTDGGNPISLVAAGAYVMADLAREDEEIIEPTHVDSSLRLALAPILQNEKLRVRQLKLEMQKRDARARLAKHR